MHTLEDLFATFYIAEKEIFEKSPIDQNSRIVVESYGRYLTEIYLLQIDTYSNFLKWYSEMRIKSMKNYDEFAHKTVNSYMSLVSNLSTYSEKETKINKDKKAG